MGYLVERSIGNEAALPGMKFRECTPSAVQNIAQIADLFDFIIVLLCTILRSGFPMGGCEVKDRVSLMIYQVDYRIRKLFSGFFI